MPARGPRRDRGAVRALRLGHRPRRRGAGDRRPSPRTPSSTTCGRARSRATTAIRENLRKLWYDRQHWWYGRQHLMNHFIMDPLPEGARVRCFFQILQWNADYKTNFVFGIGTRDDRLVKRSGRWKFFRLHVNAWTAVDQMPWKGERTLPMRPPYKPAPADTRPFDEQTARPGGRPTKSEERHRRPGGRGGGGAQGVSGRPGRARAYFLALCPGILANFFLPLAFFLSPSALILLVLGRLGAVGQRGFGQAADIAGTRPYVFRQDATRKLGDAEPVATVGRRGRPRRFPFCAAWPRARSCFAVVVVLLGRAIRNSLLTSAARLRAAVGKQAGRPLSHRTVKKASCAYGSAIPDFAERRSSGSGRATARAP